MPSNLDTLTILRNISSIVANRHDGAVRSDGERYNAGLKRDEGDPINDSRVIDGFSVKFQNENMIICYQGEVTAKEVSSPKFEQEIEQLIENVAKFIKKEYKKAYGNSLSLSPDNKSLNVFVQNTSRIRYWAQASKVYEIGGLTKMDPLKEQNYNFRNWLKEQKNS